MLLALSGEYDISCRDALRRKLDRLVFENEAVLDLTGVMFLDSTCLAELLRLHQLRQANELEPLTFVLKRGGAIDRLFQVVNLAGACRTVEALDETTAATR